MFHCRILPTSTLVTTCHFTYVSPSHIPSHVTSGSGCIRELFKAHKNSTLKLCLPSWASNSCLGHHILVLLLGDECLAVPGNPPNTTVSTTSGTLITSWETRLQINAIKFKQSYWSFKAFRICTHTHLVGCIIETTYVDLQYTLSTLRCHRNAKYPC